MPGITPEERIARQRARKAPAQDSPAPGFRKYFIWLALAAGIGGVAYGGLKTLDEYKLSNAVNTNTEQLEALQKLYQVFVDDTRLAGSTGRIALSGPVGQLQKVSRDTFELKVSKCLESTQTSMVAGMETVVDGFVMFMDSDNPEYESSARIIVGSKAAKEGLEKGSQCLDRKYLRSYMQKNP